MIEAQIHVLAMQGLPVPESVLGVEMNCPPPRVSFSWKAGAFASVESL